MSQSSNHLRLDSWTWQWVHFTQMASTVTRYQSNRALLGCGGTGDLHHGCVADKSAATAWCYHVNMDQNLWGMFHVSNTSRITLVNIYIYLWKNVSTLYLQCCLTATVVFSRLVSHIPRHRTFPAPIMLILLVIVWRIPEYTKIWCHDFTRM